MFSKGRIIKLQRPTLLDKNGKQIYVGSQVLYKGEKFDVDVNPFNSRVVIDNDNGQEYLAYIHLDCEVI